MNNICRKREFKLISTWHENKENDSLKNKNKKKSLHERCSKSKSMNFYYTELCLSQSVESNTFLRKKPNLLS